MNSRSKVESYLLITNESFMQFLATDFSLGDISLFISLNLNLPSMELQSNNKIEIAKIHTATDRNTTEKIVAPAQ